MTLNIANVDKLLAFMRALPEEHFSMEDVGEPECGTPGCILGCVLAISNGEWANFIGYQTNRGWPELFNPDGWRDANTTGDFPLARAIDVVQHLRDTGKVDWGRFPASNYRSPPAAPKPAWTLPVVIAIEPRLPESLTRLLRQPVETVDG